MSLLDDVSIVVTPNGYKAGELYAVVPVPTEGAEEVTYPNFTNSDISQWTMSSGRASKSWDAAEFMRLDFSIGNGAALYAVFGQTLNARYKVTMRVRGTKADGVTAQGSTFGSIGDSSEQGEVISNPNLTAEWQDYEFYVVSTNTVFRFYLFSAAIGDLVDFDSISVKEYTSADMDVTRATAATRVDENGLVNYAEVLGGELVDEGSFPLPNTAWDVGGGTEITINGARINNTVTGVNAYISQLLTGTLSGKQFVLTYDVIATNGANLGLEQNSSIQLNTSTVGTNRKLYFTWDKYYNGFIIKRLTSGTDVTIDNVSVKEVTRDNVPRIDYTGGGCPHILAEPMRTNLVPYSEDFSQYTNSDTTDTANTVTSPDGTVNGTTLTASGSGSLNHIITSPTYTIASGEITSSIFAKKGTVNYIRLRLNGTTGGERAWYNLNNGTIDGEDVSSSAKIEDYGNGWYRCSLTSSSNIASGSGKSLQIFIQDSGGSQTAWTANGTENIYIWGTQTEQGYGTSYIPNFGTALGVTRNQDIFTRDGIGSLINSTEGVLFAEIAALSDDGTYRYMGLTDGTDDNRVIILYYTSSTRIRVLISSGGTKYFDEYYGVTSILDFHKVAVKFKENDFALWIDGVERATDTSGSTPIGLNTLALDQAGGDNFYGKVKQLQVYDTALTDEQLLQLTGESGTDFYESYAEMASALTYTIQ